MSVLFIIVSEDPLLPLYIYEAYIYRKRIH
jgi:hypothetical protein